MILYKSLWSINTAYPQSLQTLKKPITRHAKSYYGKINKIGHKWPNAQIHLPFFVLTAPTKCEWALHYRWLKNWIAERPKVSFSVKNHSQYITSPSALYADDFCFWESGSHIEHIFERCQDSSSKVESWCTKWGFKICFKIGSTSPCKKRKPSSLPLTFQHTTLTRKKEYKFLGVRFQWNGQHSSHIQNFYEKWLKRLHALRLLKGTNWVARKRPLNVYPSLIRPVMEYGMETYFFSTVTSLDPLP